MPFHIVPVREFLVQPEIPKPLARLPELARNVLWTWERPIRYMFRRLDPVLWRKSLHNPVAMLSQIPPEDLAKAAQDPRFLSVYRRACERYDSYRRSADRPADGQLVAYFSMEYGLTECFRNYSGGLGILSGDTVKAASDMNLPFVGVGLLYQKGYFRQSLNSDGWQEERYPVNDFYTLPVEPAHDQDGREVLVSLRMPRGDAWAKVWQAHVGRVRILYLDTNIPENQIPEYRAITELLYGGDVHVRIRQELMLGIGGLRALRALGLEPTVFHLNEGHSAFLQLERLSELMRLHGLSFEEAMEAARINSVFTTHTSVPAGLDVFDLGLLYEYLGEYVQQAGIPFERLAELGRNTGSHHQDKFMMPVFAIHTSAYKNSVSKLHRHVSREMWQNLWPGLPAEEVPITSITNGVHLLSWLNGDLANLYDQYLQPDWRDRISDPDTWRGIEEIPDHEIIEVQRRRKLRMIHFLREQQAEAVRRRHGSARELTNAAEVLDLNAFTIGFARRFATYKRATLILHDIGRLKKILTNPDRPAQLIIAGKAHPRDEPGKHLIREIFQLSRQPELANHIVFVENYNILVARMLVQGCDLWLNTPVRREEACGTSGMKAGLNGVLNLSILDGWFDEAYEVSGGWAIGDRDPYSIDQNELHARDIYSLLENEIIPMYYDRPDGGAAREWMKRVKQSLTNLTYLFNCHRMISEYYSVTYQPAHEEFLKVSRDHYALARKRSAWHAKVQRAWDRVDFVGLTTTLPDGPITTEHTLKIRADIEMAGLEPGDIRVEAVVGRVSTSGTLADFEVEELMPNGRNGSVAVFEKTIAPPCTGRLGCAVRVTPNHFEDPLTRPTNSLIKWSSNALPPA